MRLFTFRAVNAFIERDIHQELVDLSLGFKENREKTQGRKGCAASILSVVAIPRGSNVVKIAGFQHEGLGGPPMSKEM